MKKTFATQLLVTAVQGSVRRGYRVIDLRSNYGALVKELSFRAVAGRPRLAGRQWFLNCRVVDGPSGGPVIVLEAYVAANARGPRGTYRLVAVMHVPAVNVRWLAQEIMVQLGLEGDFTFEVGILADDHPVVMDWRARNHDADFELEEEEPRLVLPTGYVAGAPPWRCHTIDVAQSWLRCIFRRGAYLEFLRAACGETEQERSWAGCGRVFVCRDSCAVVIEKLVGPLPAASAGIGHIRTRGRDVARLHQSHGDRLLAYLHLHPRAVKDHAMSPEPSSLDHELAWNFDLAVPFPTVFPIALFETDPSAPNGDVAVHGYDHGILCRIQLEVTCDDESSLS